MVIITHMVSRLIQGIRGGGRKDEKGTTDIGTGGQKHTNKTRKKTSLYRFSKIKTPVIVGNLQKGCELFSSNNEKKKALFETKDHASKYIQKTYIPLQQQNTTPAPSPVKPPRPSQKHLPNQIKPNQIKPNPTQLNQSTATQPMYYSTN